MGLGLAAELEAKAPQVEANAAALSQFQEAIAQGARLDAAEATRRLAESVGLGQSIEAIGIMVMRADGLEIDPVRSRELRHQWYDLGAVQEYLKTIQARWKGVIQALSARESP